MSANCDETDLEMGVFIMYFTVSKALQIQSFENCRLVAGNRGLNRIIRSVSIMDTPDTSWLKRGDLLLTTGYVFKDDTDVQIKLVQKMAKRDCAGLAIKVKRFLSSTPDAMIREANRLNLPLLEIPFDLALSDLLIILTREILHREIFFNEQTRKKEFFAKIFKGEMTHRDAIVHQIQEYGVIPNKGYAVLCMMVKTDSQIDSSKILAEGFLRLVNTVEKHLNMKLVSVELDDYIVIAQSHDTKCLSSLISLAKQAANLIVKRFSESFPDQTITVGIGKGKEDVLDLHLSFKEAREAIQLGMRMRTNGVGGVYEYTALEPDALLQQLPEETLNNYFSATLEPLKFHDQQNDKELLKTLEVFLLYRGKIEDTARALYLHRNTVKFRIARIEELLNIDLKDGEALFRLQLGLRVARLIGTNPHK